MLNAKSFEAYRFCMLLGSLIVNKDKRTQNKLEVIYISKGPNCIGLAINRLNTVQFIYSDMLTLVNTQMDKTLLSGPQQK